MAINFPDSPTDGEEYIASNGIIYTYNAANDTWTGALGTGSEYWEQTGDGDLYPKDSNADVFVGGATASGSNIVLNSSGAATFKGTVDVPTVVAAPVDADIYNLEALASLPE